MIRITMIMILKVVIVAVQGEMQLQLLRELTQLNRKGTGSYLNNKTIPMFLAMMKFFKNNRKRKLSQNNNLNFQVQTMQATLLNMINLKVFLQIIESLVITLLFKE